MTCSVLVPIKNENRLILDFLKLIFSSTILVNEVIFISDFLDLELQNIIDDFKIENSARKVVLVVSPDEDLSLGIKKAVEISSNSIVGTYPIDEILPIFKLDEIIDSLARNAVELISATRYSKGGKKYGGPVILSLISTLANLLIRIKSSNRITDFTTGIKFWNKNNFGSFEFEKGQGWNSIVRLHVFAIKNGFKFSEIPIISADRPIGVKKKITFKQKIYMIKKYLSTFFDLIMLI